MHDGLKQDCKAQFVARGFQESLKLQSESPTASKESFKLLMVIAANFCFKLVSVDIRAAFLQSKVLDRNVFVEHPADIKKEGIIWRLQKPLYCLDGASKKFWLRVKYRFLKEFKLHTMDGDQAFYYLNKNGQLHGGVITYIDDFNMAGDPHFVEKVLSVVE